MTFELDHLAVVAPDLDAGCDYVQRQLGVDLGPGGEHVVMGTHNRLLNLGSGTYLEVIAPAPHMGPPGRRRWFGLDDVTKPALAAWVARTDDLDGLVRRSAHPLGVVETLRRDSFEWRMVLRPDGTVLEGGCVPLLIQWPKDVHPTNTMADSGCRLRRLRLTHPDPETLTDGLPGMADCDTLSVETGPAALAADIVVPSGETVVLR